MIPSERIIIIIIHMYIEYKSGHTRYQRERERRKKFGSGISLIKMGYAEIMRFSPNQIN